MHRAWPSPHEPAASVYAVGVATVQLGCRGSHGEPTEPVFDASDRRAVPAHPQSQAGSTADAADGHRGFGTSRKSPGHTIYPYLLDGFKLTAANQVWSTDITYCPLRQGFMYLVAIIDWYSRYVLSWVLSNTLDTGFCLTALDQALAHAQPAIFNTDQGSQFTSQDFTARLQAHQIRISMDGKGRALDNVFVERLWRSVKYECLYLRDFDTVPELRQGLTEYFTFYNHQRLHQALGYRTPHAVHFA